MNNLTARNKPFFLFLCNLHCILILLTLVASCKTKQKIETTRVQHIEKKSANEIKMLLKNNEFDYKWISAKFSTEFKVDSSQTSFNVTLRGRKDSILWMSITVPLIGVEAARAILTKDSVKFIDRLHSEYFVGDFNYINKLLHADFDFELIQSLLIGNSVDFYDDADRLHASINNEKYVLSTVRKRKLRRVIVRNKELKDPAQTIWLDPQTFKIVRVLFNDFDLNRNFTAHFDKFEKVDSVLFPFSIHHSIKAEKNIEIQIDYSKVNINTAQSFPFSIPSKYEKIVYKEK